MSLKPLLALTVCGLSSVGQALSPQKIEYSLVGQIPLAVGQAPPKPEPRNNYSNTLPEGCLGTLAESQIRRSSGYFSSKEEVLELHTPDGKTIVGTKQGSISLRWHGITVGKLKMPPTPTSFSRLGREGKVAHVGSLQTMTLMPDGITLLTTANDNTLRVWDIKTRKMLGVHPFAQQVCIVDDGLVALRFQQHPVTELWRLPQSKRIWRSPALRGGGDLPFLRVRSGVLETDAQALRLSDGREMGYRRMVRSVVFAPNNKMLALSSDWSEFDPLAAELVDFHGKVMDQIVLSPSSLNVFSRGLSFAFSPDSRYLTFTELNYGKMTIETYLDSVQDYNYSVVNRKFEPRIVKPDCATRNNLSDLDSDQIGRDVRMMFDGAKIVYLTDGVRLSPVPPVSNPRINYGMNPSQLGWDDTIFNLGGHASTYDYTTKDFFTIKSSCEIFETRGRKPSLTLQWPGQTRKVQDSGRPFVSTRFAAVYLENDGTYIFSVKSGQLLHRLKDFRPAGFITPDILLKDDLTGVNLNAPSIKLARLLRERNVDVTLLNNRAYFSSDHKFIAILDETSIKIFKINILN